MRSIPVEVSGLKIIATGGEAQAVSKYADGVRQEQTETDEKGRTLVRVSLLVLGIDGAEEIRVKVPSANVAKDLPALSPVTVLGLIALPYLSGNRVAVSYRAEAVNAAK